MLGVGRDEGRQCRHPCFAISRPSAEDASHVVQVVCLEPLADAVVELNHARHPESTAEDELLVVVVSDRQTEQLEIVHQEPVQIRTWVRATPE